MKEIICYSDDCNNNKHGHCKLNTIEITEDFQCKHFRCEHFEERIAKALTNEIGDE